MRHEMCDPWYYMKSVWGRCMVELTDLTITIIYECKLPQGMNTMASYI